jgi:16S rRNA (guanine527-N7)-methyltransferase
MEPEPSAGACPPSPSPEARLVFGPVLTKAEQYAALLAGPGVVRGLVGPHETKRLWERHLLNSAALAPLVPRPSQLADLGSGAGLPGIVLAMLLPEVTVTLLEPMQRRVQFLRDCLAALDLGNATVLRARAEEAAGTLAADVVTARAVAPLDRLAALAVGLVRPGGVVLAIKGTGAARELAKARPVLTRLGVVEARILRLPGGSVGAAATVVRLVAGGG